MYTSYIGKHFIGLYNQKNKTNYTAESFFDKEFFPLFFKDSQNRHMMHVHNSPFFQKPTTAAIEKYSSSKALAQYANLREKIQYSIPDGGIFVGYGTKVDNVTSGQMSNLPNLQIDKEEIYASWIGQALAIGVSGGHVFLLKNDRVLWKLYKGWKWYRKYLEQTPNIKDKQIETWNGNWLVHSIGETFDSEDPIRDLNIKRKKKQGTLTIETVRWSEIFYKLSSAFPKDTILINAYKLAKTNTTLGFIQVFLPEVRKPIEYRKKLIDFKAFQSKITEKDIEKFETFYNFRNACQMGSIGLKAMEPYGLREYMPKGSMQCAQGKKIKFNKEESYYYYEIYQTWIMATLNKTQLLELASQMASILTEIEDLSNRGKTDLKRLSEETRNSKNMLQFIENLSKVVLVSNDKKEIIKSIVQEVLKMPTDHYPLFITLIRFEYNYQSKN